MDAPDDQPALDRAPAVDALPLLGDGEGGGLTEDDHKTAQFGE